MSSLQSIQQRLELSVLPKDIIIKCQVFFLVGALGNRFQ